MGTQGRQLASLSYPHKHESSTLANSYSYYESQLGPRGAFLRPPWRFRFFLFLSDRALSYQGKVFPLRKGVVSSKAY